MARINLSNCQTKRVIAIASLFLTTASAQCYYPGGFVAVDQYPCDEHAYITLCCPLGYTCFSNSLCVVTDQTIAQSPLNTATRGTCTNPLWNNAICGDFCLNDGNNGSLQSCGDGSWCCSADVANGSCDCASDVGTFSIGNGIAQTIIGVSSLKSTSTDFSLPSSTSIASLSKSTTISQPSTSSSGSSSKSKTTQSAQSTSTSSTSHSSSTASATSASQTSTAPTVAITQTTGFKAGISVGVLALAAIIAGIVGFYIWRKRQRGRRDIDSPSPFQEYQDSFHASHGRNPAPHFGMQGPDPYQFHSPSPVPRGASQNSGFSTSGGRRFSPPVVDPYRIPYEGT